MVEIGRLRSAIDGLTGTGNPQDLIFAREIEHILVQRGEDIPFDSASSTQPVQIFPSVEFYLAPSDKESVLTPSLAERVGSTLSKIEPTTDLQPLHYWNERNRTLWKKRLNKAPDQWINLMETLEGKQRQGVASSLNRTRRAILEYSKGFDARMAFDRWEEVTVADLLDTNSYVPKLAASGNLLRSHAFLIHAANTANSILASENAQQ